MAAFKPNSINYIIGLDIGIASVGWAMVEIDEEENPIRLIDLGVRVFERAEVLKTGDSRSGKTLGTQRPPPDPPSCPPPASGPSPIETRGRITGCRF